MSSSTTVTALMHPGECPLCGDVLRAWKCSNCGAEIDGITVPDLYDRLAYDPDVGDGELAEWHEVLGRIVAELQEARKTCTNVLAERLGRGQHYPPGWEITVRKNKTYREWDHEEVAKRVVSRAVDARLVDETTGEVLESEAQAVARGLLNAARPSWRTTVLRDMGIDPDEFCVTDVNGMSCRLVRVSDEEAKA